MNPVAFSSPAYTSPLHTALKRTPKFGNEQAAASPQSSANPNGDSEEAYGLPNEEKSSSTSGLLRTFIGIGTVAASLYLGYRGIKSFVNAPLTTMAQPFKLGGKLISYGYQAIKLILKPFQYILSKILPGSTPAA
ncbi:MAG: hypothetical protein K2X66_07725 [Cyanobacteria bacterium]|nr:hypothetical protein [Cyanobacteriota bacterium]